ncbi:hypothetical protein [Arenibacterium halophilum]|uniref:Tetratricopeptide repeat protein n=1 Tax=Arenibacterium halophilum TaxID=2583821 RepID=A0ABY2XCG0_9RHOB|nr:hypothetical protein [Arenibacterium halophilum]TMV13629.1 hypothetical protein FGK64_12940 [Arenibacterium halophilum]
MDDYGYDLGSHGLPVSTSSDQAQLWFDRGLNWLFGFNHAESIACFRRALEFDPGCAMAHWGIAYALGPNYNMPWDRYDDAGRAEALAGAHAATLAAQAANPTVPMEQALIAALSARYPSATAAPLPDMQGWDRAFADAMRKVQATFPDQDDIRALFAESLLNLTPWKMWTIAIGTPAPGAATKEAQTLLETGLATPSGARHPGILHLYVHLMEMSPTPERALPAADALRTLMPDAGHLIHMATHIDVLCGHYRDVVHWNQQATLADMKYYAREGAFNIYTGYRQHNYHFAIYGAMFLGQLAPALEAIQGIRDTVPESLLRIESPPMADYFESFTALLPHVLIRFGKWHDILALPAPKDPELHCTLAAFTSYAKAVAHAALGDVPSARAEAEAFARNRARVPDSRLMHNNRVTDLLAVADRMMWGEITYREGAFDTAFAHLRHAIALEDALPYDEPWGWMQPVRHALGALLFEQGRTAEAEATYREDLGLGGTLARATVHPDNVWALRGLHDCLKARGDTMELPLIAQRLTLALARADRAVAASCFCAQSAMRAASA